MPDVIGRCPFCGDELQVTRIACPTCHSAIEGTFSLGRFQRLNPEQLAFLEVFIKNRGVIRNVEAELGKSYPTIRNMLDDVIRALGFEVDDDGENAGEAPEEAERRRQVLDRLGRGEISADEAVRLLKR